MVTTIALHPETKKKLDKLKVHDRETYEDVIKRLIERGRREHGRDRKHTRRR